LRQLLVHPLRVGADELDVVGARFAADGEGDQRVGGAGGVGAAGGGGDAGELVEPVHELLQVGTGDDDVVQQVGDAHERSFLREGTSGSPRESIRRSARWKQAAPLITSTISAS